MESELGPIVDGFHMYGFPVRIQKDELISGLLRTDIGGRKRTESLLTGETVECLLNPFSHICCLGAINVALRVS